MIMLQKQLNKDQLLQYTASCIETLDPHNEYDRHRFQSGLQLYRKGHVYNVSIDEGLIEATVEDDAEIISVSIDLLDYDENRCDCFETENCEHMLAVLFYCASSYGAVGDILSMWKQQERPTIVMKGLQRASSLLQRTTYQEEDLDSWFRYFDEQYDKYVKGLQSSYYTKRISHTIYYEYYKPLEARAPKKGVLNGMFRLHALLFSVEKLFESFQKENNSSFFNTNTLRQHIDTFVEDLEYTTYNVAKTLLPNEHQASLKRIEKQLDIVLSTSGEHFEPAFDMYRLVWTRLLHPRGFTKERVEGLSVLLQKGVKGEQLHYELCHLHFLLGNDKAAIEQLDMLQELPFYILTDWILYLDEKHEDERIQNWLLHWYQAIQKKLPHTSYYEAKKLIMHLLPLYEEHMKEGYDTILQELLPFSYVYYCDYVIDNKQYRTWAELQMLVKMDPFYEAAEYVKIVEKHDREALIPLYHYWITHYISMKNRPSYKQAIRYLKKLRTIYRKEKRLSEWEVYVKRLSATHSRLRAFQEELKKGKLIDDN
ncbi:hypothetical protein [Priestia taiwanensis]|uniref:SWIM-type domain-containing protein n=1 Tax=Priestia taiwanensis TaxID=1347902 RepID=A0A917AZC5_9BACI|nr:hypothetical protein [Priestia taiwanensis]MBM7364358.1 hypothetical protein [Priestia taiwanensis]GGE85068.1 hypothetical protein GCM10007140_38250 [Priestia taiwanensis]